MESGSISRVKILVLLSRALSTQEYAITKKKFCLSELLFTFYQKLIFQGRMLIKRKY